MTFGAATSGTPVPTIKMEGGVVTIRSEQQITTLRRETRRVYQ